MRELKEHKVYEMLNNIYKEIPLDYVIFLLEEEYKGVETHKKAVIEAFNIFNTRTIVGNNYNLKVTVEQEKMSASLCSIEELLQLPEDDYYDSRPKGNRCFEIPQPIPYWYAFLEPPYGVPYLTSDFVKFNDVLFPFKGNTEVYRWNDDFSNYFDDGKEWWGTGLWSAYDKATGILVIIGASQTD